MTVGVLALQGDFEAHSKAIGRAGGRAEEVRTLAGLESVDGLVIPGGESTTMLKLLNEEGLFEPLRQFGLKKPIFGTCAGAILLAREVSNPEQPSLNLMDIGVQRNAYGRQLDSRVAHIECLGEEIEAVFIRAPIIRRAGPGVTILASYNGDPVLVSEGMHMAATFHPELTASARFHAMFLDKLKQ